MRLAALSLTWLGVLCVCAHQRLRLSPCSLHLSLCVYFMFSRAQTCQSRVNVGSINVGSEGLGELGMENMFADPGEEKEPPPPLLSTPARVY